MRLFGQALVTPVPGNANEVCFRVVKASPSAWHVVLMPRASGRRLSADDMVISKHCVFLADSNGNLQATSSSEFAVDPVGANVPLTANGIVCWR